MGKSRTGTCSICNNEFTREGLGGALKYCSEVCRTEGVRLRTLKSDAVRKDNAKARAIEAALRAEMRRPINPYFLERGNVYKSTYGISSNAGGY